MWIVGNQNIHTSKFIDKNDLFERTLHGELDDETARSTLAEFLRQNIKITTYLLTGIYLKPYQVITIRGWFNRNFSMAIWGRANGKSFTAQVFVMLYAIFNANSNILVVSQNFRSSRRILEHIEQWSNRPEGILLKQTFAKKMERRPDIFRLTLKNGSQIACVPLSNGEGLRGLRANVLIIDEGLLVPEQIIEGVLKPFLGAKNNITENDKLRELEDKLIRKGILKPEERTVLDIPSNKMIILSSASYTWEYLYKMYLQYLGNINQDPSNKNSFDSTYFVSQLSYEIIPPELLDRAIKDDIDKGNVSEDIVNREYKARFTDNSSGYFKANRIKECVIPVGSLPCVELVGDKKSDYIIAIDPSLSASEASDHFAMCVLKIISHTSGKKVGVMVHGYAVAGGMLNDHIEYFKYLIMAFNPVYIINDSTQGARADFISVANESQAFKQSGIELKEIEADFSSENMEEIYKSIKATHNKQERKIVHKQIFGSSFLRSSNEWLQACIENKRILFASQTAISEELFSEIIKTPLPTLLSTHTEFVKQGIVSHLDLVEYQDYVIDLTQKEMIMIVPKANINGVISYDLPNELKKIRGPNRPRRDSYTAMLLASWGMKCWTESQMIEESQEQNTFDAIVV